LGVICPARPDNGRHAFNLYTIRHPRRDAIRSALAGQGIGHSTCYPTPLALQAVYDRLGHAPGDFPVAEQLGHEVVSLPVFPDMTPEQVDTVCTVVARAIA